MTAEEAVARLGLVPHPEGGFYRETYRSPEVLPRAALPERFSGPRAVSTAILYLLPEGARSRLHRIASDELWHYHLGGPLEIVELTESGDVEKTILGPAFDRGEVLQKSVAAGRWFGARPSKGAGWCLAGCTVAPGFDFADFELGRRQELLAAYPSVRAEILALTD
ncbi:MAG: cupin domain-containing protein [Elusimicrobiota bacterium]